MTTTSVSGFRNEVAKTVTFIIATESGKNIELIVSAEVGEDRPTALREIWKETFVHLQAVDLDSIK